MNPVIIGRATHIYALCDEGGSVRYVGKTVRTPAQRFFQHRTASKRSELPVGRWLRRHPGATVRLLEIVPPCGDWAAREAYWINAHENLLNLTDGGEGLAGHQFSEEHKTRISQALSTREGFSCERCGAPFTRKQCEIARGNNRFCTKACYQASQRGVSKPLSNEFKEAARLATKQRFEKQTHCKRGHPLFGENLFLTSQGSRGCKECRQIHKKNYRERLNG